MRKEAEFRMFIRGDLELWGVDKIDGSMATIVGQIRCSDSGRWPVQREFNRRMKRRFQECGIDIATSGRTVLMQIPASTAADDAPGASIVGNHGKGCARQATSEARNIASAKLPHVSHGFGRRRGQR